MGDKLFAVATLFLYEVGQENDVKNRLKEIFHHQLLKRLKSSGFYCRDVAPVYN